MKKNNFKSLMQAAVLVCTPLVIASCDDVFGDVDNPIPAHLTVSQATVNLELHAARPDAATFIRKGIAATGAQLVYSSSNEKVATVNEAGKITGVGEGECKIIVKATGLDGNGNPTYQEAEDSFTVKVKDYRARIALKEGVEIPVYNSARKTADEKIDMKKLIDVWPALGTTSFTVSYNECENELGGGIDPENVINSTTGGNIELTGNPGKAKVVAKITGIPTDFEKTSFPKAQQTDTLVVEVKAGVAYITKDEEGADVTNYMFKNFNGEKVTDLSTKLTGGNDVYLEAGWYYLDQNIDFNHNVRVKGDVNIILGQGNTLTLDAPNTSIMDDTTAKSYSLNFYKEAKTGTVGTIDVLTIQDFKEVNFVDGIVGATTSVSLNKIGTVSIGIANLADATFKDLENIETLNFKNGKVTGKFDKIGTAIIAAGDFQSLTNVTTLNFKKGTVNKGMYKVGTATISDGTFKSGTFTVGSSNITAAMLDVTTLDFKKGTVSSDLNTIGTATISDGSFTNLQNITTLDFKKGTVSGILSKIGTATISDGTFGSATAVMPNITTLKIKKGTITAKNLAAETLIIDGGTITVDAINAAGGTAITGNVILNDGKLTVESYASGKQAIVGNVEVVKGTFSAINDNYAAVSGTLTGEFEGSIDNGNTWSKITTEKSSAARIKNVIPAP